jgi:transcription antitermination factor NusG
MDDRGKDIVSWYAVRTRARNEFKVRDQLEERKVEVFLPVVEKWRQWSDRRKLMIFPLFSGYCFTHIDLKNRLPVLTTPGVVEILGNADGPLPIPDDEIAGVQRLIDSKLPHNPHSNLEKGMPVEVINGPLTGLRGTMARKGTRARFVISVHLIGQGVSVELDAKDLIPLE